MVNSTFRCILISLRFQVELAQNMINMLRNTFCIFAKLAGVCWVRCFKSCIASFLITSLDSFNKSTRRDTPRGIFKTSSCTRVAATKLFTPTRASSSLTEDHRVLNSYSSSKSSNISRLVVSFRNISLNCIDISIISSSSSLSLLLLVLLMHDVFKMLFSVSNTRQHVSLSSL
jgi:hypothetical protein